MRHHVTVRIAASPADVWAVLADVLAWPTWTPTVTSVAALSRALDVGSRYWVKRPGALPAVWEVTDCVPEESFAWATRIAGSRIAAGHRLAGDGAGSTVTITLDHTGGLAGPLDLLLGKRIRRMVDVEAANLKARCET